MSAADVRLARMGRDRREMKWMKALFISAFPPEERPPFYVMRRQAKHNVDWWKILDGERLAGFFYVLRGGGLAYVFHFAVHPDFRGRGVGTAAVRALMRQYAGDNLFLAIERIDPAAENYAERVRRKNFYLRCGLRDLNQHVQEGEVVYELLGTGGRITNAAYRALIDPWLPRFYRRRVKMEILD